MGKISTLLALLMCIIFFLFGTFTGMVIQQKAIETSLINVLTYTDLDLVVNFNETKFVQEFNNTIVPEIKNQILLNQAEKEGFAIWK
jgi:hypothetical protein